MHRFLTRPIRVVSIVEASFVTGPAKGLLEFAQRARTGAGDIPGVDLSLATYERGAGAAEENNFVKAAREAGIRLDLIAENGRFDASVLPQIRRIVTGRSPDIVETHNVKSHFLLRLSGLWRARKWLAFHHGYTATDLKMKCYNQLDRWSLRVPDRVITVCGPFAQELTAKGVSRSRIIVRHNSVKPFAAAEPPAVEQLRGRFTPGVPILPVVGRLSHEKGQGDFLEALRVLMDHKRPFHAVLVGEGPDQAKLEALRARLGLNDSVTLAGLQHDVRPYYGMATMVVMPSRSEGSPNVLLEAMAAGVPAVATRVGGIPEIAKDGETALLIRARDPRLMAAAIERLLDNPALGAALASAGRQLASEQFSPEPHRRWLVGVYSTVLAEAHRA